MTSSEAPLPGDPGPEGPESSQAIVAWVRDAARALGSPAPGVDWEDVAQAAAMLVFRDAPGAFRGRTRESLRAYCRTVTRRRFLMERRIAERQAALAGKVRDEPTGWDLGCNDALALKEVLGRLSGECRNTLRMYFLDGFSHREIGGVLGVSEIAARKRASRCMEKARELAGE